MTQIASATPIRRMRSPPKRRRRASPFAASQYPSNAGARCGSRLSWVAVLRPREPLPIAASHTLSTIPPPFPPSSQSATRGYIRPRRSSTPSRSPTGASEGRASHRTLTAPPTPELAFSARSARRWIACLRRTLEPSSTSWLTSSTPYLSKPQWMPRSPVGYNRRSIGSILSSPPHE